MLTPQKANKYMFFQLLILAASPILLAGIMLILYLKGIDSLMLLNAAHSIIVFYFPLIIYTSVSKQKLRDLMPMQSLSLTSAVLVILLTLCMLPVVSLFSAIGLFFAENNVPDAMQEFIKSPFIVTTLGIAVIPAVCEELIFRGVIMTGYKSCGIVKAVIISSLFFAIMHLNPHQFFYALPAGIFFGALVYCTNSIFASMLAHFTLNFHTVILCYLTTNSELLEDVSYTTSENLIALGFSFASALFALPFLILFFRLLINNNKKLDFAFPVSVIEEEPPKKIVDIFFIAIIALYLLYIWIF